MAETLQPKPSDYVVLVEREDEGKFKIVAITKKIAAAKDWQAVDPAHRDIWQTVEAT